MHLKGCYDFFRPPRTKYEMWLAQHEKKKRRREEEEARLADQELVALSKMCSLALYSYQQQYHHTLALTHSNHKQHVNLHSSLQQHQNLLNFHKIIGFCF